MTPRIRLPSRRPSENFTFEHAGMRFVGTVSRFPDGGVAEVFLGNHRVDSHADVCARDAAILLSFALQHGADIETIRRALCRDSHGRAQSPVGAAVDRICTREVL
jgi:hypothetical protein